MFCRCHQRANSGFQIERMVYDEGWDLFGYAGWSPKLEAMVVSFRYPANPPEIIQSLLHISVLAVLSVMVTLLHRCACSVSCHKVWAPGCTANSGMDCARGTDSHSIYNWAENMRYWSTDFDVPFPGSEGAKVHTGVYRVPPANKGLLVCRQSAAMLSSARDHHSCKRMHVRLCQRLGEQF